MGRILNHNFEFLATSDMGSNTQSNLEYVIAVASSIVSAPRELWEIYTSLVYTPGSYVFYGIPEQYPDRYYRVASIQQNPSTWECHYTTPGSCAENPIVLE